MAIEREEGIRGLRAVVLVTSFALVGLAYPLSGWVSDQYNVLTGEGEEGMVLVFIALPLVAGVMTSLALWRLGKGPALLSGVFVCAGAVFAAVMGS